MHEGMAGVRKGGEARRAPVDVWTSLAAVVVCNEEVGRQKEGAHVLSLPLPMPSLTFLGRESARNEGGDLRRNRKRETERERERERER